MKRSIIQEVLARDLDAQVYPRSLSRRKMLGILLGAAGSMASVRFDLRAAAGGGGARLGIGMHSFGFHWQAARNRASDAQFSNALEFLDYCHGLGAGGVQVAIASRDLKEAGQIRAKAESRGMYFEGQLSMPKDDADAARFEDDVRVAKEAGATVLRTAFLSGRRYETFQSAQTFQ